MPSNAFPTGLKLLWRHHRTTQVEDRANFHIQNLSPQSAIVDPTTKLTSHPPESKIVNKHEKAEKEEARRQVLSIVKRMALLHYSFAKTLVDTLGEKRGRKITRQAADFYGELVGRKVLEKTLAHR